LADVKNASTDYLPYLQNIARNQGIAIATSFYSLVDNSYFNQGYIVSSTGDIVHKHKKIYLAPPERDNDGITAGKELTASQSDMGKVGMLICKDGFNRFSHFLYEKLNDLGVEIICIPTWSLEWDELDTQEYIKSLFVYGAFASRAYILVSGNLNKESKSFGRSLLVSPVRGVLHEGSPDNEELIIEEIDLDEVKKARKFDSWWQPKVRII
jgi:predicted amidohydrolase